jgi:hypothetical protein
MNEFKDNHFGKIPHGWFDDNEFIRSLTPSERWILVCLVSYIWRSEKEDPDYEIDKKLVRLYRDNGLLITLMSERTIKRKCCHNRSTVRDAINKFDDIGALIKVPGRKGKGFSNLYIMGLAEMCKEKDGKVSRKQDNLFSNSPVLRAGGRIPDDVKDFIRSNFIQKRDVLRLTKLPGYNRRIFPLIFENDSPLIPARVEIDEMEVEDLGKGIVRAKPSMTREKMAGLHRGVGWIESAIWLENGQELAGRAQPLKKGKET